MTEDDMLEEMINSGDLPLDAPAVLDEELTNLLDNIEAEANEESDKVFAQAISIKEHEPKSITDSHVVFLNYHNAMSDDMQTIEAFLSIQSEELGRVLVLRATWDASSPRQPTDIIANYYTDLQEGNKATIEQRRAFKEFLVNGKYIKRDFDMSFSRLRGFSQLHDRGGVAENITASLGRNAGSILSFLNGGDDYEKVDLTYNDSWGAW